MTRSKDQREADESGTHEQFDEPRPATRRKTPTTRACIDCPGRTSRMCCRRWAVTE